ncbi:LPP20 family lipoprotein [Neptunicella marina]|uniref:LPP20 family lipoprotein n=1 Tax=Neptunicella marina TaxID=2125989 RepID=A0A8J6M2R0_9ALTE|nr:LPP20 family lipoprotein [Neptunicella marina]MBC3766583.1 LPP20 family lipoprotein [Neptunicella marina]
MKKSLIVLPAMVAVLTGCGSTNKVVVKQQEVMAPDCVYQDAPQTPAPKWICDITVEGFELTAVGFSEKRPTASMTSSSARADANVKMSEHFANNVAQMLSEYQKSVESESKSKFLVDTDMVRQTLTGMTLYGTKIIRSMTSPTQGQYVLMAMDKPTYEANAEKAFAALASQDGEMRQAFDDKKTREELMKFIKIR